jgi:VanZ family protein
VRVVTTWGPLALWVALMITVSSIPNLHPPAWLEGKDVVFHLAEFAVFGLLLYRSFSLHGWSTARNWLLVLSFSVVVAAAYEAHKLMVAGRHTSVIDFITDLFGALAGLGLAQIGLWRNGHA